MKVGRYFKKVGSYPPRAAWLWGEQRSLLAWLIAHLIFFLRCLSPLQHIKETIRSRRARRTQSSQRRRDIEARETEIYFLAIAVVLSVVYLTFNPKSLFGWSGWPYIGPILTVDTVHCLRLIGRTAVVLILVECLTWISYYLLWRAFAEPRFTLFHPAEYFVLFPVLAVVLVLSLALLTNTNVANVIEQMRDGEIDGATVKSVESAIGQFLFLVVLANLLSMFPAMRFKSRAVISIVGAGDVVANRIIPALKSLASREQYAADQIVVYTNKDDERFADELKKSLAVKLAFPEEPDEERRQEIVKRLLANGAPVIIATPPDDHLYYMTRLSAAGVRFAVEKPMTRLHHEIEFLHHHGNELAPLLFALSYYALEKALPLTYLLQPNHNHEEYLHADRWHEDKWQDASLAACADQLSRKLGRLQRVRITLFEEELDNEDRRAWITGDHEASAWSTKSPEVGIAFETMIHPVILLFKILKQQGIALSLWRDVNVRYGADPKEKRREWLRYRGSVTHPTTNSGIAINLNCAKGIRHAKRVAVIHYEHGTLCVDFDDQSCIVKSGQSYWRLSTKREDDSKPNERYAIQMKMVRRFFNEGWADTRYDDYVDQVEVLTWLDRTDLTARAKFGARQIARLQSKI